MHFNKYYKGSYGRPLNRTWSGTSLLGILSHYNYINYCKRRWIDARKTYFSKITIIYSEDSTCFFNDLLVLMSLGSK